jgi:type II secretory pathway component PulM
VKLSKREKYIAIGVAAAIALVVLDQLIYEPLDAQLTSIDDQRTAAQSRLNDAQTLFARERRLRQVWTDMEKGGLQADSSAAESQLSHAILDWESSSGVVLAALKPERATTEGDFQVIGFHVTATGSLPQVARLFWYAETASIPVRLTDIQITPRHEGTDDLSVQLSISTLCLIPSADQASKTTVSESSYRFVGGGS